MANRKTKFQTVQLPPAVHSRLKEVAQQEHRSMAKQIETWVEQHILRQFNREAS